MTLSRTRCISQSYKQPLVLSVIEQSEKRWSNSGGSLYLVWSTVKDRYKTIEVSMGA